MNIPLNHYDIFRILESGTDLETDMFISLYPRQNEDIYSVLLYGEHCHLFLANKISDNSCIFLGENNFCSIYKFRPNTCRTWPFTIDSLNTLKIDDIAAELVEYSCDKNKFRDHSKTRKLIKQGINEVWEYINLKKDWNRLVKDNEEMQTLEELIRFFYDKCPAYKR